MSDRPIWMVRAGEGAYRIDDFKDKSVVAIGWGEIGPLDKLNSREAVVERVHQEWPEWRKMKVAISAGQLYRFAFEMEVGDGVLTYDPSRRVYLAGTVKGPYAYRDGCVEDLPNTRDVAWESELPRDRLSVGAKNVLGAISTVFLLPDEAAADVERVLKGEQSTEPVETPDTEAQEDLFKDIQARAIEFIKDKVNALDWDEMQELVAGLLRAMGYKTRVSPSGPDRGKDIVASPDGFGFESPRIVVEIKHRNQAMGAPEVRSFIGGRHADDKGLYVSTGGFTKEAHYEAERANIPLTLMDIEDLVQAVVEHYEDMDIETQRLLPLKKLHWPA